MRKEFTMSHEQDVECCCFLCRTVIFIPPDQVGNILGVYCPPCAKKIAEVFNSTEFQRVDIIEAMKRYTGDDGPEYIN